MNKADIGHHPNVVLEGRSLKKTFRDGELCVDVLRGVDVQIQRGERVAIIGASGEGKSTLLHLLGGLERPSAGAVWIDGQMLYEVDENTRCTIRNRKLGFVYQFHHLLPEFTVLENVMIPLLLGKKNLNGAKRCAKNILEKVGLKHRTHHKLGELSGGERQRTAIARALVTEPVCVLADEPTGNLDHQTAEHVYETMLEINRDSKTSLLIVTHDLRLANRMDRVLKLENGILVS